MDISDQKQITRLCIQCALLLLQYGAESMLVEQLSTRLGLALGMDAVESSIFANAVVLTTLTKTHCITTTRKNVDHGINMHLVTEVQHIVILAEKGLLDVKSVDKKLSHIKPFRYPTALVVLVVGMSCSCFCKLNGGSWDSALVAFLSSAVGMFIRQMLTHHKVNPLISFCVTAFFITSVSGWLLKSPIFGSTSTIAMASSVLLLVPGFPLINAVADMFKGHINTGLARWAIASLLTLFTSIGIVAALTIWGFRGWI